jgi:uncharacterized membrane protein YdbT with pleckstrin-like domain
MSGMSDQGKEPVKPTLLQVMSSVLAAAFGVQSTANRERDFAGGSATVYIVAGIIFTVVFIFTILTVVRWVLG